MKRKIIAIVTAAACLLGTAGCSGEKKAEEPPGLEEIVWYYPSNRQEDQQMVYDAVNEKLKNYGLRAQFELIDQGAYNDKMNLLISSGGDYDICWASNWLNDYKRNVDNNAFYELDQLLETDFSKLKDSLPEYLWDGVRVNQKIYAIPNYQNIVVQPIICTTKRLAEKYNFDLDSVKKLQDIEPMLEVIKNNEPGLYPYRSIAQRTIKEEEYEVIPGTASSLYIKKTTNKDNINVELSDEINLTKEQMLLTKDWYDKGYIRKDALTVTNDLADLDNLKYGMWWATYKPGNEAEWKIKYGEDIVFAKIGDAYLQADGALGTVLAISVNSEKPKEALRLIEIFNTDKEIYNLMAFGIEGVHYDKISDNKIRLVENKKYKPNDAWKYGNQFNAYVTEDQPDDVWEKTIEFIETAQRSPIMGFSVNPDPVKSEIAQLQAITKEYEYLTTGAGYSEEKYEEYLEKMETAGVRKVRDEVQKQLEEYFRTKK